MEPERRRDGSREFRRLAGLLAQPLAALAGPGYDKPVWHCVVRAAPGDRMLSDAQWAQAAAGVMDGTGLARAAGELGVRWVAVRHAPDHVHLVATLARQDGTRPRVWNDFYRVLEACQDAEARFGLRCTAPADRTAAQCPSRAETEQAARRRWSEPPRVTLRREVCVAAAGAATEQEFFARLADAGVLVRKRYSITSPGEVSGYAVGVPEHTTKGGAIVWHGGGKLAADLSLPKLRRRWPRPTADHGRFPGQGLPAAAARAVLRSAVAGAAGQVGDEAGFLARLGEAGVLMRLRFSEITAGQVTEYAVGLAGHQGGDGEPCWYGKGRLSAGLTLPRLRRGWDPGRNSAPERSGTFRCTVAERNAIYEHAARQAATAAGHIRRCAAGDPGRAADAAWAAADTLHVAARALGNPALCRAADSYDRAARARYGRIPRASREGNQLRGAARLLALAGQVTGDATLVTVALTASLVALAAAVAGLRQAQQHAAQAAAARAAAAQLQAACVRDRSSAPRQGRARDRQPSRPKSPAEVARGDVPGQPRPGRPAHAAPARTRPSPGRGPLPPRRAGPGR